MILNPRNQNLERLEVIHSMLAAGHRCVHLEKHSFLLWGVNQHPILSTHQRPIFSTFPVC